MDERLILSEAIDLVTRMIAGYANRGQADRAYIGAMAQILMEYPKAVAMACANPIHGVVRECKFMPTPSDMIGFCEKRTRPICEQVDREVRVKRQIEDVEAWRNQKVSGSLKAKGRAWLDRSDPVARKLSGIKTQAELAAEARARLEREFGLDLVDAVPDAPVKPGANMLGSTT